MNNSVKQYLQSWIPHRLSTRSGQLLFEWLYTGTLPYTDPFFDETLAKCRQYPQNSGGNKSVSTPEALAEWSTEIDSIQPTAFIFHVSRCGSTLVSQALGMLPRHISLAEVPLFDSILRMGYQHPQYDEAARGELLKAAIQFYGAKRTGAEEQLFIKADSWHLCFYKVLRKLYPHTPFIILYRNPEAVLHSNHIKKGVQGVYGLVEPELLGLHDITVEQRHPDVYMTLVLEQFYKTIAGICNIDNNTLLLNYNQGLPAMMQAIADFTGLTLTDEYKTAIDQRGQYNAKHPGEKFKEREFDLQVDNDVLQRLHALYEDIDRLRLKNIATV